MAQSSKPKVLVAISHQGWIRPEMLQWINTFQKETRAQTTFLLQSKRPYENALNNAAELAKSHDFLLHFDHDNIPTKNPYDLLQLNKDVIGLPYPGYRLTPRLEIALLAMDRQPNGEYLDHRIMQGLQEVDAVASGAILISSRVLNAGIYFEREWKEGVAAKGVDFYFCEKAKAAGFSIYAHYDYLADHIKEVPLLEIIYSYGRK